MYKKLKEYFSRQRNIVAVYVFGSHAKGKSHASSDIDIAVLFGRRISSDTFESSLKISCDLMQLLSCNRVDVIVLNTAAPVLKNQIYKYGKLILCNEPVGAIRFKAMSILEYLDFLPVRKMSEIVMRRKALSYG